MDKARLDQLNSTIKSSYRTLAIFEYFAEVKGPATATEIYSALGTPQSSTATLLKSLVDLSYLSFDPEERTYKPTMRLHFLAHWTAEKSEAARDLPILMRKLSEELGETSVLCLRSDIYSQYIYVHPVGNVLSPFVEMGSVRALVSCASGWAMLQDESDFEIGKLIRRTIHELNDPVVTARTAQTLRNIAKTREQGYALTAGDTAKGLGSLALPLPTKTDKAELAIAVAGPKERILDHQDTIKAALTRFAQDLPGNMADQILAKDA